MLKIKYVVVFQSCSICLRPIMFLMIIASLRLQKIRSDISGKIHKYLENASKLLRNILLRYVNPNFLKIICILPENLNQKMKP